MKSKTPGKVNKRKAVVVAAPQADDDGDEDEGGTSSRRKIQKVRSDKGKERTKINKIQLRDGVRRIKVNTKWQILNPEQASEKATSLVVKRWSKGGQHVQNVQMWLCHYFLTGQKGPWVVLTTF